MTAKLNVNIDHVATIREARKTIEPSIITAAVVCEQAGAHGITVHIRQYRVPLAVRPPLAPLRFVFRPGQ